MTKSQSLLLKRLSTQMDGIVAAVDVNIPVLKIRFIFGNPLLDNICQMCCHLVTCHLALRCTVVDTKARASKKLNIGKQYAKNIQLASTLT